jgi:hypothetical protein
MRPYMLLALATAACKFVPGEYTNQSGDALGGDGDARMDSVTDVPMQVVDADNCYSAPALSTTICFAAAPSGTTDLSADEDVDTDGAAGTQKTDCRALLPGSTPVCALSAGTFRIAPGVRLDAHGGLPLAIVASSIQIEGTIDVASHLFAPGPDANQAGCSNGTAASGVGGGQGGSFGGPGGNGGDESGQTNGGVAGAPLTPTTLRGGCRGGLGGNFDVNIGPGNGGGAVLLIASSIELGNAGVINASGASALGGSAGKRGGHGAGSGGMIVLVTPSLALGTNAMIFANGGHGGGGSDSNDGGGYGLDPTEATGPNAGGIGGGGGGNGAAGGPGFPAGNRDGVNGSGSDGAGGAGGGAGVIKVFGGASLSGNKVSPQPS